MQDTPYEDCSFFRSLWEHTVSWQINTAFVQTYKTNVEMLLQQMGGKLSDCVTRDRYVGKAASVVEQFGRVTAVKNMARNSDTPLTSVPQDRRWVYPSDYDASELIDQQDRLRLLADVNSGFTQSIVAAMRRAQDEEILLAFFRSAQTGENGTTPTAFPGTQVVAATIGGAGPSVGMNLAKLRAAKKLLIAASVDVENDPLYVAMTSADHDGMLTETQAVSLDYNDKPVLVDGMITKFMGFNFKLIEFISQPDYPQAQPIIGLATRQVPVWAKSGMHLGTWNDLGISVDQRPDKRNSTQIYATETIGATRLQENKVVQILCV